jgi:hypothetical protein
VSQSVTRARVKPCLRGPDLSRRLSNRRIPENQKRPKLLLRVPIDLYPELRVENTLTDEKGYVVSLKEGAHAEVVVEA